jgi:hypothetical protein
VLPQASLFCFGHFVSEVIFSHSGSVFAPYVYRAASPLPARVSSIEKGLENTCLTFHSLQQSCCLMSSCLSFLACVFQIISHGFCKCNAVIALSQSRLQCATPERRATQCPSLGECNDYRNSFTRYICVLTCITYSGVLLLDSDKVAGGCWLRCNGCHAVPFKQVRIGQPSLTVLSATSWLSQPHVIFFLCVQIMLQVGLYVSLSIFEFVFNHA